MTLSKKLKKLERRICRLLCARHDRPLPPETARDKALTEELRAALRDITEPEQAAESASEEEWLSNVNRLGELVFNEDPREFLRWDIILKTMYITCADYTKPELKYLRGHPDWNTRWRDAVKESHVGHPVPYWRYPDSSENLIHHAYHIAQFEDRTGRRIDGMDFILEFGAGYGSMCRLIHKLGFRGRYVAFDLPAFSALQKFFLKSMSLTVHPPDRFREEASGIACVSDISQLSALISGQGDMSESMFVATWSISETPVGLRDSILPLLSSFKAFLIAYQAQFREVDNIAFFKGWTAARTDIQWWDWKIEQIPNHNRYLVGRAKSAGTRKAGIRQKVEVARSNS